jgi:hypothetical protein
MVARLKVVGTFHKTETPQRSGDQQSARIACDLFDPPDSANPVRNDTTIFVEAGLDCIDQLGALMNKAFSRTKQKDLTLLLNRFRFDEAACSWKKFFARSTPIITSFDMAAVLSALWL